MKGENHLERVRIDARAGFLNCWIRFARNPFLVDQPARSRNASADAGSGGVRRDRNADNRRDRNADNRRGDSFRYEQCGGLATDQIVHGWELTLHAASALQPDDWARQTRLYLTCRLRPRATLTDKVRSQSRTRKRSWVNLGELRAASVANDSTAHALRHLEMVGNAEYVRRESSDQRVQLCCQHSMALGSSGCLAMLPARHPGPR